MSGYTEGPWYLDDSGWIVTDCTAVCLISNSELNAREKADARLIAAAPDLLEALGRIACAAECSVANQEWIAQHARAAIAKARGEK